MELTYCNGTMAEINGGPGHRLYDGSDVKL